MIFFLSIDTVYLTFKQLNTCPEPATPTGNTGIAYIGQHDTGTAVIFNTCLTLYESQRARCNTSSSSEDSMRSVPVHAREYVESLHQNRKANLLYGKNNVRVLPVSITT